MIIEKAERVLEEYNLCNHCLGRLFAKAGKGKNVERGASIRLVLNMEREIKGIKPLKEPEECVLCSNVFDQIDEVLKLVKRKAESIEFGSFLIGSRFPEEILKKEKEIVEKFEINYWEPINREFNRELGKKLEQILKKPVNKHTPDVVFIVNPYELHVEVQIKPIFVYGRYKKLVRDIPQTPFKGYKESVASVICRPFSRETNGKCIFHGAGREDIDVRMLGNGRPFILEIKNPKRRVIDLDEIAEEINASEKVEVLSLRFSTREEMKKILTHNSRKVYEALIYVEDGVNEEDVKKVEKALSNVLIQQKTPKRVLRRRADIIRKRKVYWAKGKLVNEKHFKLRLFVDGGLYIKELISGDEGRTVPSVSSILKKRALCKLLDVLEYVDNNSSIKIT
ncbi:tRNA pseudouridine(54/55) synthase Pus10 [Thermococcus sp.]